MSTTPPTEIHGTVAPGFEPVRDAFARNFAEHAEVGAACAVRIGGEEVVDLWGGIADPATGRAYEADTLQLVFSSTKGIVATAIHRLAEQGVLDLDAPVAQYWPEFAANGKADISIRSILGHRSGVIGIDGMLTVEEFVAWDPVVNALAAAAPVWEPDTDHGYHALSFGFLLGELVKRTTGQSIGAYVRDHVSGPVGAEFVIGVSDEDLARVAPLIEFSIEDMGPEPDPMLTAIMTAGTPTHRAFLLAPVLPTSFNEPALLQAEIPSANGCTSARSLARIYGALVSEVEGTRLLSSAQVDEARTMQSEGADLVMVNEPNIIGNGFFLSDPDFVQLGPGSFGHSGMGGSCGVALPEREIGFGYVMNQMVPDLRGDPRSRGLMDAVLACTA